MTIDDHLDTSKPPYKLPEDWIDTTLRLALAKEKKAFVRAFVIHNYGDILQARAAAGLPDSDAAVWEFAGNVWDAIEEGV